MSRAIHVMPAFKAWRDAALKEPYVIAADEVDWPKVKKTGEA